MTTTAGGGQALHIFSLIFLFFSFILSVFPRLNCRKTVYSWRVVGGFEFKIRPKPQMVVLGYVKLFKILQL